MSVEELDYTGYIVEFTAQTWLGDYALSIDPLGDTVWDLDPNYFRAVVEHHAKNHPFGTEGAYEEALEPDTYISDEFKEDPNAPEWVREHSGPFYCTLIRKPTA